MQRSNAPTQLVTPFAQGATGSLINNVPLVPYTGQPAGQVAYSTGFTSVNMNPLASGGIPPWGADVNGLFFNATTAQIWEQAGYQFPFNSTFVTAVGGYPAGGMLPMASGLGFWLNQTDNNSTNPDTSGASGWVPLPANQGATTVNGITGGAVVMTPNQLGAPLLILTGTLTSNAQVVLGLTAGATFTVQNLTTGAFTLTVGGSTGSTVTIAQGASNAQTVYSDGTNWYTSQFNGAGVYLPIAGTAVAANKWATARTITYTGGVTGSLTLDGSANVTCTLTIAGNAPTASKWASPITFALTGPVTGSALVDGSGAVNLATSFAANPSFSGTVTASSNFVLSNASSGLVTGTTQGLQIVWNTISAGNGRLETINNHGTGGGGHYWYERNLTTSTATQTMSLDSTGNLTSAGAVTAGGTVTGTGTFAATGATAALGTGATGGTVFLCPNTVGNATGRLSLDSSGNVVTPGAITGSGFFAASPSGTVALRPNGPGSATGQATLSTSGNFNVTTLNTNSFSVIYGLFTGAPAPSTQGTFIGWNQSGGNGEMNLINNHGGGTGGWTFSDTSGSGGTLTTALTLSAGGNLLATGTVRGGSDARIKSPPVRITNALAKIRAYLVGMEYERLDQPGVLEAGFIGQAVNAGLPRLVSVEPRNGITDFHSVAYGNATAYLANGLTELHDLVLTLLEQRA